MDRGPAGSNRLELVGPSFWRKTVSRTDEFIQRAMTAGVYSFDVEHDPQLNVYDPASFELLGVGFSTDEMTFFERDMGEVTKIVDALFPTEAETIAYNGKYDLKCLTSIGMTDTYRYPKNLRDPMIAVNLLDENRRPNEMSLKVVVYDQFGHKMMPFDEAWKYGPNSSEFTAYGEADAYWEMKLYKDLKPKLIEQGLWKVFTKILMPMTLLSSDIEWSGVAWDIAGARELLRGFQKLRNSLRDEILGEIGELNLDSGDQLARRLFEELGYATKGIEMTKSGKRHSTDAKAMEKLAKKYPVCDKITKYRTANKMISTYVEPLTRMALEDPKGRVHPTIWLVSTTGRSRMEKPNFQNIPAWLDEIFSELSIRKNIVAASGWRMIVADLSQIELRFCAHVTQDPVFLAAYRDWQCGACKTRGSEAKVLLHSCPKCGAYEDERLLKDPSLPVFWHGLDLHQITTDSVPALGGQRQRGKAANFAFIYFATAMRMHYEYPEVSVRQWEEAIYQYFERYQGVRRWHVQMEQALYNSGVTMDVFGRKRRIPRQDIHRNPKHALNQFINFPIQSAACEYIELAMIKIREECLQMGTWMREIFQSNFVHDESCHEVPEELVGDYTPLIRRHMENAVQLSVPIRVNIQVVDRWGSAKS